jgi:negative regulator of flagellin synthesis FlgM
MTMGIDGIQGKRDELQVERQRNERTGSRDGSTTQSSDREDSFELSSETQEFLRIRKLVDAIPDVRHDRVEQLKQEIARGTYNVPAKDIAEAILNEWI